MKWLMQNSSLWSRIIILTGVALLCMRICTIAYAIPVPLPVIAVDVDTTLVAEDTAEEFEMGTIGVADTTEQAVQVGEEKAEVKKTGTVIARWGTMLGYAAKTIKYITYLTAFSIMLNGEIKEAKTLTTLSNESNQVGAQGSAKYSESPAPGTDAGADVNNTGNTDNFTNQLANYNQPAVTKGNKDTDTNSISKKTVNFLSNSANTLIGGNSMHSAEQATATKNYVVNASGGGIGMSKPDETWRKNTTPEAVEYNAYYNNVASTQSQSTNALLSLQSSKTGTTIKKDDGSSSQQSPMSQAMGVITFQNCLSDPNDPDKWKNPFVMMFCVIQNAGALFPAVGSIASNITQSTTGLLGGLNSSGSSGMNAGVVVPMHKEATDAAAGSQANAYKKSAS